MIERLPMTALSKMMGAHTHQYVVLYGTPMDDSRVANGNTLPDIRWCCAIRYVNDRIVLDV